MGKRENGRRRISTSCPSANTISFERKSGLLFGRGVPDTLAKAVSAFANSGGGHRCSRR